MTQLRNLTGVSFEAMTAAFNDAFSDYNIPANYTVEYLRNLVTRRGYRADLSAGAFDGDRLVGFVFNGLDGEEAYNSGTGVAISHRRRGIARQLMGHAIRTLPVKRYILEVIEANERAATLYRQLGFLEMRRVQCWSYTAPSKTQCTEIANPDLDRIRSWCDISPTWQNEVASIRRASEPFVVLGNEDAAAVMFPSNGDVPILAVRPEARRHGLGRKLLDATATRANLPLRIMNIDDRDAGIAAFLEACGAKRTVRQIEMMRRL
ncbi:MAG: GNAT family N-acetyltransferase [Thermoanaerobaculia bacterium]